MAYVDGIKAIELEVGHNSKGMIISFHGSSLVPPQSMKELKMLQVWRKEKGLNYPFTFVFTEREGRLVWQRLYSDINTVNNKRFQIFENIEPATLWIT